MDLGSTITALVIVLVCIIPFIIMGINNRKKKQQFLKALSDQAEKSNCSITRHEIWANTAIGIDDVAGVMFFMKKADEGETLQQVALSEVQNCRLIKTGTTEGKDDNYKIIDMLGLGFSYHNKNKEETFFEFYVASAVRPNLSGELELANNWLKIADDKIAALAQRKK